MKFCWEPTGDEKRYLQLIISMSVDCCMGRGTEDRRTYTENLRACANQLDDINRDEGKKGDADRRAKILNHAIADAELKQQSSSISSRKEWELFAHNLANAIYFKAGEPTLAKLILSMPIVPKE